MTENQWPQDGSFRTPTATQQTPLRPESTFPPVPNGSDSGTFNDGATSRTDVAKDEAADVKRQAADSAQTVAETAKTEATNVAAEVKTNAKDLLQQAKSDLTDQAGTQQQKVAEGLRSVSSELHSMASASTEPGVATDLVRQAAERSSAVASWLDGRDPGSLLTEVKSFARQRPGTFLLLAAGAGVLAGRLSRSLSAGAPEPTATGVTTATRVPDTGMAVPPPPVQMPAPETTTAGLADTYPPSPLDADPLGNGSRQDRWDSEPVATDPLRDDPFRDDPFDGGRR
ncbi:ATP synthase F0 subunit B [Arthrobacter sp. U41]|uniref:ATP synthase F0 subunit B n=1 Tax=Arthrobacter sp. U41 TaxID=1849032 RepID=UPI0011A097C9|nr:ATP synthase F0 subunit B [Arthrobacter sp. U41]